MDISGLSDTGLIAYAQSLNASRLQDKVSVSVMAMANRQAEQQGQNALQLIASADPSSPLGNNFNVMA